MHTRPGPVTAAGCPAARAACQADRRSFDGCFPRLRSDQACRKARPICPQQLTFPGCCGNCPVTGTERWPEWPMLLWIAPCNRPCCRPAAAPARFPTPLPWGLPHAAPGVAVLVPLRRPLRDCRKILFPPTSSRPSGGREVQPLINAGYGDRSGESGSRCRCRCPPHRASGPIARVSHETDRCFEVFQCRPGRHRTRMQYRRFPSRARRTGQRNASHRGVACPVRRKWCCDEP